MDEPIDRGETSAPVPGDGTSDERALSFSRLTGILGAIGCVAVAMGLCSVAIRSVGGSIPIALEPADPTIEDGQQQKAGAKIATLVREGWAKRGEDGPKLGILLGSSATKYGIDTAILEAESPVPTRWMNLAIDAGNAEDSSRIARMVFRNGIRPDVVVLGLHQEMLARTIAYLPDPTSFSLDPIKLDVSGGKLREAFGDLTALVLAGLNRAFPRRMHTTYHFREAMTEVKFRAFQAMGIGIDGLFAPDSKAWVCPPAYRRTPARPDDVFIGNLREKGWFEGDNYRLEGANAQGVLSIVDECEKYGNRLVIVLTPQVELETKMLPARSEECLREVLEGRDGHRPDVLDLRKAVPDEHFADYLLHTDEEGRAVASHRLADYLKTRLGAAAKAPAGRP